MSYFNDFSKRLFFVFGQTNDVFYENTLERLNLKEKIYAELVELNYQRVVYYNRERKLYFMDNYSMESTKDVVNASPKKELPKSVLDQPPMGNLNTFTKSTNSLNLSHDNKLHLGRLSDQLAFRRLDTVIKDERIKSAIIIDNADDFIRFFGTDEQGNNFIPILNLAFNRWENLDVKNMNIIIFIFPHRYGIPLMNENYKQYEIWSTYMSKYFKERDSSQVIEIGMASKGEIANAIHYYRITQGLNVKVGDINLIANLIYSHLYRKNIVLKDFEYVFNAWVADKNKVTYDWVEKQLGSNHLKGVLSEIDQLIGMNRFKLEVKQLIKEVEFSKLNNEVKEIFYYSRLSEHKKEPNLEKRLHYCFMGNPGTGKTTVAKLLGKLLAALNLLPSDKFKKVTFEDLEGGYVGQTGIKTREVIENQVGGVLFIDEAYQLHRPNQQNDFGKEALTVLTEAMSDHMGEISVILAGYPTEMEDMLKNGNQGLMRRFGNNKIYIEDYTPDELFDIFKMHAKKRFDFTDLFVEKLKSIIKVMYETRDESWANADAMVTLLEEIEKSFKTKERISLAQEGKWILDENDIPVSYLDLVKNISNQNPDEIINKIKMLKGGKKVADVMEKLASRILLSGESTEAGHFIFVGNPGTGKTSVAQYLGELLKRLGILKKGHLVAPQISEFVGVVVGESTKKTTERFNEALDGVLFIDEAYALVENNFKHEIVNVINDLMEKYRHRMCVVFAGYPQKMKKFLDENVGLASRIMHHINFEDLSLDDLINILTEMADEKSVTMSYDYIIESKKIFLHELHKENFGNARFIRNYLESSLTEMYHRISQNLDGKEQVSNQLLTIISEDIPIQFRIANNSIDKEGF